MWMHVEDSVAKPSRERTGKRKTKKSRKATLARCEERQQTTELERRRKSRKKKANRKLGLLLSSDGFHQHKWKSYTPSTSLLLLLSSFSEPKKKKAAKQCFIFPCSLHRMRCAGGDALPSPQLWGSGLTSPRRLRRCGCC
jgi:hypothetical protein